MDTQTKWIHGAYKNGGTREALEKASLPTHTVIEHCEHDVETNGGILGEEDMCVYWNQEHCLQDIQDVAEYIDKLLKDSFYEQYKRVECHIRKLFPDLNDAEIEARIRKLVF